MIGIFDSGSGGLTVLRAIREKLPSVDIVYFGDIANSPYGSKTQAELMKLTVEGLRRLQAAGATSIVSACNSVSASLAVSLFDSLSIPSERLIEMVGPTIGYFKGSSARILLCATKATIDSEIYQNGFAMMEKKIETVAIPGLASSIEFGKSDVEIETLIREAFKNVRSEDFDVVILGCTHYPLVTHVFQKILGTSVDIFDPATAVAERVEDRFWPREVGDGITHYLISKESQVFRSLVGRLFPDQKNTVEVV